MNSRSKPPPGCYRKRLCMTCKAKLMAEGYLVISEPGFPQHADCERCRKRGVLTSVNRYTLSAKGRRDRGLN